MAWSSSEPALYDAKVYPYSTLEKSDWQEKRITFELSDFSGIFYKNIALNLSEKLYEHFIGENSLITLSSSFQDLLGHEIGHVLTGNMSEAVQVQLKKYLKSDFQDKTMEIAAESTSSKKKGLFRRVFENTAKFIGKTIDFCSGGRVGNWIRKKVLEAIAIVSSEIPETIDDQKRLFNMTFDSETLFTNAYLFQGYVELMQILGFFVQSHKNDSVLYLNMLSDCARSVQNGTPIRIDHLGKSKSRSFENMLVVNRI